MDLPAMEAGALRLEVVEVVRMRDLYARQAEELLIGIAEDLAQPAVDPDEAPVEPDVGEPRSRQLEGAPEALFAVAQRRFRPLAAAQPHSPSQAWCISILIRSTCSGRGKKSFHRGLAADQRPHRLAVRL